MSSKPEAAFAVAAVAVAMASAYPRVKNLMLCHFHSICPVLVPFYIPKPSGVSEEDHKRYPAVILCNYQPRPQQDAGLQGGGRGSGNRG